MPGNDNTYSLTPTLTITPKDGAAIKVEGNNILEFQGEEKFCQPFQYKITFQVPSNKANDITFDKLNGAAVKLNLEISGPNSFKKTRYIAGVIKTLDYSATNVQGDGNINYQYVIEIVPTLNHTRSQDAYTDIYEGKNGTRIDLVKSLYEEACGKEPAVAVSNLPPNQEKPKQVIRWRQPTADFIQQQLYLSGVTHYYTTTDKGEQFNICGTAPSSDATTLNYLPTIPSNPSTDKTIASLKIHCASQLTGCTVSDYDPAVIKLVAGKVEPSGGGDSGGAQTLLNNAGMTSQFPTPVDANDKVAGDIAKSRTAGFNARTAHVSAKTFWPLLQLSDIIEIGSGQEFNLPLNDKKGRVVTLSHHYRSGTEGGYSNEVQLIPSNQTPMPEKPAHEPNMHGFFPAIVSSGSDTLEDNQIKVAPNSGQSGGNSSERAEKRVYLQFMFDPKKDRTNVISRVGHAAAGKSSGYFSVPREKSEVLAAFPHGNPNATPIIVAQTYNGMNIPAFADENVSGFELNEVGSTDSTADGLNPVTDFKVFPKNTGFGALMKSGAQKLWMLCGGDIIHKAAKTFTATSQKEMVLTSQTAITLQIRDANNQLKSLIAMTEQGITLQVQNSWIQLTATGITIGAQNTTVDAAQKLSLQSPQVALTSSAQMEITGGMTKIQGGMVQISGGSGEVGPEPDPVVGQGAEGETKGQPPTASDRAFAALDKMDEAADKVGNVVGVAALALIGADLAYKGGKKAVSMLENTSPEQAMADAKGKLDGLKADAEGKVAAAEAKLAQAKAAAGADLAKLKDPGALLSQEEAAAKGKLAAAEAGLEQAKANLAAIAKNPSAALAQAKSAAEAKFAAADNEYQQAAANLGMAGAGGAGAAMQSTGQAGGAGGAGATAQSAGQAGGQSQQMMASSDHQTQAGGTTPAGQSAGKTGGPSQQMAARHQQAHAKFADAQSKFAQAEGQGQAAHSGQPLKFNKQTSPDGKLASTYHTNPAGQLHGPHTVYHPSGLTASKAQYVNGALQGKSQEFNKVGQLINESSYANNELHGVMKSFDNGKLSYVSNYAHGQKSGIERAFHPNGNTMMEQHYSNGQLHGESRFYTENKTLLSRKNYANGKLHGDATEYFSNGKISKSARYTDGRLDGTVTEFNPVGKVTSKAVYHSGKLISSGKAAPGK